MMETKNKKIFLRKIKTQEIKEFNQNFENDKIFFFYLFDGILIVY